MNVLRSMIVHLRQTLTSLSHLNLPVLRSANTMGRATRRRPRPTGLNAGVFQGRASQLTLRQSVTTHGTDSHHTATIHEPLPPHDSASLRVTILGGRTLAATGPSWVISLPTLASYLWCARESLTPRCSSADSHRSQRSYPRSGS